MRKVTIGSYTCVDPTPATLFASQCANFLYLPREKQVLDLDHYATEVKSNPFSEAETAYTIALRSRAVRYANMFPSFKKLTVPGMLSREDGAAMICGLDHDPDVPDWLTYHHPRYKAFIEELSHELISSNDKRVQDAAGKLLTDYSYYVPYGSCIHHDGQYSVRDEILPKRILELFKEVITPFLIHEFVTCEPEDVRAPLNVTKGTGFNTLWPDGTQYTKSQSFFIPKTLDTGYPTNLFRYDNEAFKLAWVESGRVFENLDILFDLAKGGLSIDKFLRAFEKQAISVHTEAYRANQPDALVGSHYTKDRFFSYENPKKPLSFLSGTCDNKRWTDEFMRRNPSVTHQGLRKRAIFPAPNASFSVTIITLCRMLMHRVESTATSFPNNRSIFFDRYQRVCSRYSGWKRIFLTFDRSNSEQFISDNWDKYIRTAFPDFLRPIVDTIGVAVLPSTMGPRVVLGCLPSGTAQTTLLNWFVGLLTMSITLAKIGYGEKWEENYHKSTEIFLKMIFACGDEVTIGDFVFLTQSGTDDQSVKIFFTEDQEALLKSRLEYATRDFGAQKLNYEITDKFTGFGLDWGPDSLEVSASLSLVKLFLMEHTVNGDAAALKMEHTVNGDAAALKMDCRLKALPDYYDLIKFLYKKHGLGSLSSYERGSANCLKNIAEFGYPVEGFLNAYSPVDTLVMSTYLQERGVDPRFSDKRYPLSFTEEVVTKFRRFCNL